MLYFLYYYFNLKAKTKKHITVIIYQELMSSKKVVPADLPHKLSPSDFLWSTQLYIFLGGEPLFVCTDITRKQQTKCMGHLLFLQAIILKHRFRTLVINLSFHPPE